MKSTTKLQWKFNLPTTILHSTKLSHISLFKLFIDTKLKQYTFQNFQKIISFSVSASCHLPVRSTSCRVSFAAELFWLRPVSCPDVQIRNKVFRLEISAAERHDGPHRRIRELREERDLSRIWKIKKCFFLIQLSLFSYLSCRISCK